MMLTVTIIFWAGAFAIFYAYAGYPLTLKVISFFKKAHINKSEITPSVSLIISAFNEEAVLASKLTNALALDYPRHLLEIAVISDGSTDNTNDIIEHFAGIHDQVIPCISPRRKGKTACLNDFVPTLKGEIALFSDANAFYDTDLIRRIVRPFADYRIGLVTGSTRYVPRSETGQTYAAGFYSRLEELIKSLESETGSCVGADGAVFAIRRSLFSPLKADDINDLVIPFQIIAKGYRCVMEPGVCCTEKAVETPREFQRQIRITSRTLRAVFSHKHLLNPFAYPLFSFKLFSHKVMRLMTPFWMMGLLFTNGLLALGPGAHYKMMLVLQGVFYACALNGLWRGPEDKRERLIAACAVFLAVNAAYLIGWFKYLKGETYTSWEPERS